MKVNLRRKIPLAPDMRRKKYYSLEVCSQFTFVKGSREAISGDFERLIVWQGSQHKTNKKKARFISPDFSSLLK